MATRRLASRASSVPLHRPLGNTGCGVFVRRVDALCLCAGLLRLPRREGDSQTSQEQGPCNAHFPSVSLGSCLQVISGPTSAWPSCSKARTMLSAVLLVLLCCFSLSADLLLSCETSAEQEIRAKCCCVLWPTELQTSRCKTFRGSRTRGKSSQEQASMLLKMLLFSTYMHAHKLCLHVMPSPIVLKLQGHVASMQCQHAWVSRKCGVRVKLAACITRSLTS